jgi:hypothetical protein
MILQVQFLVHLSQVFDEIYFDAQAVPDIQRAYFQSPLDRQFDSFFEIIGIGTFFQAVEQLWKIGLLDFVDADRLAECLVHRLGDLVDVSIGIDRVLDFLLTDRKSVHGHAGTLGRHDFCNDTMIEHDVTVGP